MQKPIKICELLPIAIGSLIKNNKNLHMKYILSLFIGLALMTVNAQNYIDLGSISYAITPQNKFENSSEQSRMEELDLKLNFPVVIDEKNVFLTGLYANRVQVKLDPNISENTNLNSLGLVLGLNHTYSEKWSATYVLLPKISSDLNELSGKDFQLSLLSLFNYTKKSNLNYKIGLYANTERYGLSVMPLLGFYYQRPDKKFEANLILPYFADVNYQLFERTNVGLNFDGLGSSYNMNKRLYIDKDTYAVKSSQELFAYLMFQLGTSFYIKPKLGYSIFRTYEVFENNDKVDFALASFEVGDNRTQLNTNFKDGAIFKIELVYRVHFN